MFDRGVLQVQCFQRWETRDCVLNPVVNPYMRYLKDVGCGVQGALRIAHCGGFHSVLNTLVKAVNLVAKLLRHPIHWDTETIGCNPSLSSIAVLDQRTFKDALQEIAQWLALPENADEFLVLYLDDQPDLLVWVSFFGRCPLDVSTIICEGPMIQPLPRPSHGLFDFIRLHVMCAYADW